MRAFSQFSIDFLTGVFAKSRLILLFMAVAVVAMVWSDAYTRSGGG